MRPLTTHHDGGLNDRVHVHALGAPGPGGAATHYQVDLYPLLIDIPFATTSGDGHLPDGLTNEALLAILLDRLEGFQAGPFACGENAVALDCLRMALNVLRARTAERRARGVLGRHAP